MKHISNKARKVYSLTSVSIRKFIQDYNEINENKLDSNKHSVALRYSDDMVITINTLNDMKDLLAFDEKHKIKTQDEINMMRNSIESRMQEEMEFKQFLQTI